MIIGVFKEIKNNENCVVLIFVGVMVLIKCGYQVFVQVSVGEGSGFFDVEYEVVGVIMLFIIEVIYEKVEMIIKVKEFIELEYKFIKEG